MTVENHNTGDAQDNIESRRVVVANDHGLHARPAGKLAQTAQSFAAEIQLVHDDQEVDAKSILDVLTLAAAPGEVIEVRASGADASAAADALEALFKRKFDE